ncbi:neutral ceramidase-like [Melitaea cinxia]|uniref:neutral ceramidase-like n=1 Tax=Melitaea cinxia TaxID=113334 RepID=UPI001E26FF9D|nr:neutral ceramidase-like [Melitaea cinxia]
MAISLTGKLVITFVTLAVIGGLTAVIVLLVTEVDEEPVTVPTTTSTQAPPIDPDALHVGVGIADMTGPCVEITFMGYAELGQSGQGIHLRQFARTFIFVKGDTRIVLVTAEMLAVGFSVRRAVVQNLQERFGEMYSLRNVIITGTHTHSGPGGHLVDFLLDVSTLGFSRETYDAYVNGITNSIINAHTNLWPARLIFGKSRVENVQMNRSPFSYEHNPSEERARYETNYDDELTQVRILKNNGDLLGVLNWFSVHVTSMNMSNHLVSSDNLGYAALKLEATLNPSRPVGRPQIVAGFFASSIGDVSPNTRGARCEFSGDECDNQFQLCALFERCFSTGPGEDMFESTRIIGERIYQGALEALSNPGDELSDDVAVVHQFLDMPLQTAPRYDPISRNFFTNETVGGCVPALGYSFASGTTDGANILNITQGTLTGNPLLDAIGGVVAPATDEDVACHQPKPILLATGRANFPVPWHSRIISLSVLNLGGFVVAGIPGEPTTMAGRRIKDVVGNVLVQNGLEPRVAVSALTNEYIHYVSTFEEYQIQRYEAASTLFGPHTLEIMLHRLQQFTLAALQGVSVPPGPEPEDHKSSAISIILPVVMDSAPLGTNFGDVIEQPPATVRPGETVSALFVGANPRNDLFQESSYLEVQRFEVDRWVTIATDSDWDTIFSWERETTVLGMSRARVQWRAPPAPHSAPLRLLYRGAARSVLGELHRFTGVSRNFTIV